MEFSISSMDLRAVVQSKCVQVFVEGLPYLQYVFNFQKWLYVYANSRETQVVIVISD